MTGLAVPGTDGTVPVFADAAAAAGGARAGGDARGVAGAAARHATQLTGIDAVRARAASWPASSPARPDGGWLEPAQVQDVLEAFGLPVLRSTVVDGPDEAVAAFAAAGRPVALKAVADGVLHKAAAGRCAAGPRLRRTPYAGRRRSSPRCSGRACAGTWSSRWRPRVPSCSSG